MRRRFYDPGSGCRMFRHGRYRIECTVALLDPRCDLRRNLPPANPLEREFGDDDRHVRTAVWRWLQRQGTYSPGGNPCQRRCPPRSGRVGSHPGGGLALQSGCPAGSAFQNMIWNGSGRSAFRIDHSQPVWVAMSDPEQPIPELYREAAEQVRQLARQARLTDIRGDLLSLAAKFERLAANG